MVTLEFMHKNKDSPDDKLIHLLEKQKRELVVRALRKHEEIKSERAFSDKIIASLSDILLVLNDRMEIVKTNEEFCRSLGYDRGHQGLLLAQVISPDGYQQLTRLIREGEFKNYETELVSRSGRRFLASINGSAMAVETGGASLSILVARDKTEVYEMMAKVRESQVQLIHSGRLASLGEMAAGIAHELTQPLNAILLFAKNSIKSLSEQPARNGLVEENLNIIVDRVKKASSIIKSLKSFARKTDEEMISMNLNTLLKDILRFLDSQLRLSDISVELLLDEQIPSIMAHNVRLEQVFLNIIQNAIQAMDKTENPRLTIRTGIAPGKNPITMKTEDFIVAGISDNGDGIAPENLSRIFDPFFTTREVGAGMGLGLSIVDRIVRDHHGHIRVDSTVNAGTCFSVCLPLGSREAAGHD